jgi:hypothetical protein
MSKHTEYDPKFCDLLPTLFENGASITKVCVKLDIHRDTYYEWKKRYPDFADAAKQGELQSQVYWEEMGQDGIFGGIDKFAGSSWQFVMKNRFRDSYQADNQPKSIGDTFLEQLLNTHEIKPK